jgi:hypothetical protein
LERIFLDRSKIGQHPRVWVRVQVRLARAVLPRVKGGGLDHYPVNVDPLSVDAALACGMQ